MEWRWSRGAMWAGEGDDPLVCLSSLSRFAGGLIGRGGAVLCIGRYGYALMMQYRGANDLLRTVRNETRIVFGTAVTGTRGVFEGEGEATDGWEEPDRSAVKWRDVGFLCCCIFCVVRESESESECESE